MTDDSSIYFDRHRNKTQTNYGVSLLVNWNFQSSNIYVGDIVNILQ